MRHERGNILFLILLAVVLFAALSYAVTQSTQGGGKNASNEKDDARAAELLNYFSSLDVGVQRMLLTGGVKDYQLSFYYQTPHKYVYGGTDNQNCTSTACHVFDPAGGGVIGKDLDNYTRGQLTEPERIFYTSVPGAGTSLPDIVIGVSGVTPGICRAINRTIGVNDIIYTINNTAIEVSGTMMYQFATPLGPIPDTTTPLTTLSIDVGNKGTFCGCNGVGCDTGTFRPIVYHVILAR